VTSRGLTIALAFAVLALGIAPAGAFAADPAPAGSPAPSGDPDLSAKVDAAIANATSYRIAVRAPSVVLTIRSFGPDRIQVDSDAGSTKSESVVVGNAMYYRPENGKWQTFPVPSIRRVRHNRLYMGLPDALLQPLPDRVEDGVAVGAFRSLATGNGALPGVMDCTYERVTYRPRACTVSLQGLTAPIQVTYAGWDDPANVIEPPPGVPPPVQPATPAPVPGAPH
jgi:hypothetical protein